MGGRISLVSSNVQPNHVDWPGKIIGWPVPSAAFRLALYERLLKEAQSGVELFENSLSDLDAIKADSDSGEPVHSR